MSTTQVPPEIMEEIESKLTNSTIGSYHWIATLMGIVNRTGEFMAKYGHAQPDEETVKSWGNTLMQIAEEVRSFGEKNSSRIGAQIVLEKQWIDVNEDTKLPTDPFIGCEKGSNNVGEVILYNDKVYRITDFYHQDSITLSFYQPLPAPPQTNK